MPKPTQPLFPNFIWPNVTPGGKRTGTGHKSLCRTYQKSRIVAFLWFFFRPEFVAFEMLSPPLTSLLFSSISFSPFGQPPNVVPFHSCQQVVSKGPGAYRHDEPSARFRHRPKSLGNHVCARACRVM